MRGTTLLKSLAIGLPVAFSAVLLASTAQAAACAGSGVITRIQGLNTDVAISRAGKPVSRIRVLEPASATLSVHTWSDEDPQEFRRGWRVDVAGGQNGYTVELSEK